MPIYHMVVDETLQHQLRVMADTEEQAEERLKAGPDTLRQFRLRESTIERTVEVKGCFDTAHPEIGLRAAIRDKLVEIETFAKHASPAKLAAMAGLLAMINAETS